MSILDRIVSVFLSTRFNLRSTPRTSPLYNLQPLLVLLSACILRLIDLKRKAESVLVLLETNNHLLHLLAGEGPFQSSDADPLHRSTALAGFQLCLEPLQLLVALFQ